MGKIKSEEANFVRKRTSKEMKDQAYVRNSTIGKTKRRKGGSSTGEEREKRRRRWSS